MEKDFVKELKDTVESQKLEILRLKGVIESLPGSIYWKDQNGVYLGRNIYSIEKMQKTNLEHTSGADLIIGKTDEDIFSKETAERYWEHDMHVMQTGTELAIEEPVTLPNGEKIIQLSTKRPLYDECGGIIGIVGNTVDITYLKKIEEALRQEKERAETASRAKTEFLSNMSHDLRTPFTGVLSLAECLESSETDLEKKELLSYITQSAQILLDHINEILDFIRSESGGIPRLEKQFELNKTVQEVFKMITPSAKAKALSFTLIQDEKIPQYVIGDGIRTQRILINLLSNSVKFTETGSIRLSAELAHRDGQEIIARFIIEDTGQGIPEDKQHLLFEPFGRLTPSYKGVYPGKGVGLRMVKHFLEEMGGEVVLESKMGQGTKLKVLIPYRESLLNRVTG